MDAWQLINRTDNDDARRVLHACCGSTRWVDRMIARRPFAGREELFAAARDEWFALGPDDWREAFSHHPRIGDRESLRRRFPDTHHLSEREQAGVGGASRDVLTALAALNRAYKERFGFIFILCATGLTATEMLAALESRLANDPATEIRIAAEEQARITAIRLGSDLA